MATTRGEKGRATPGSQGGPIGARKGARDVYLFGTDEYIANLTDTGYRLHPGPNSPPNANPPAFVQIKPEMTGKDVNQPSMDHRDGNLKFSGGF